jgi:hypothetical protein
MKVNYSQARSLIVRGESLFPMACFGAVKRDWEGIGDYLMSLEEWDRQ